MKFSPETHRRRDGLPFRVLAEDFKREEFPIVVAVTNQNGEEYIVYYPENGLYKGYNRPESADLLPIKKTIKVPKLYLYIYTDRMGHMEFNMYTSPILDSYATSVKEIDAFEIEEGVGL